MRSSRKKRATSQGKRVQHADDAARVAEPEAAAGKIRSLTCEIKDLLGTALSLGGALELMGFGMRELGDDYSSALITVTETLILQLKTAMTTCGQILAEDDRSVGKSRRSAPG